jgi:hypothetical protein
MVSIGEKGPHRIPLPGLAYVPAWDAEAVAAAWESYTEPLLRQVASNALKPRQKHPVAELREKLLRWHENPPQVDRRLRALSAPARTLLALLHLGKRAQWRVGALLELASCLHQGQTPVDGLKTVEELFLQGLVVPVTSKERGKLSSFEDWLGQGIDNQYRVWIAPEVLSRAAQQWEALPALDGVTAEVIGMPQEADGLEWFLRLGVLWQLLQDTPARLTQQGTFFKRDHDRLTQDAVLNQPLTETGLTLHQQGHFLVALGLGMGLFRIDDTLLHAEVFPAAWQDWAPALTQALGVLSDLTAWSVKDGWAGVPAGTNPWPSALLTVLGILLRAPEGQWVAPRDLADWMVKRHCFWSALDHPPNLTSPLRSLLLGWLFPLRLIQVGQTEDGGDVVRLTPLGRAVLSEKGALSLPHFPKTLLAQPNLELVAYRQGLAPQLVAELSRLATWKTLGAVCLLQIDQPSVHRGMAAGATFESAVNLLDHHGVHPPPGNVVEALRTWAAKRERLAVYQGANLLEFASKDDLDAALRRSLVGIPLADRYLLIENEEALEYRHFRTLGTRDYALPPSVCVAVGADGVTLQIDAAKADLLLETELLRFSVPQTGKDGREYLITPASLAQARYQGLSLLFLEDWFVQRTGQPISPAVRLLWNDRTGQAAGFERLLILKVSSEALADGLWQWPETRQFLQERLGPTALAVPAGGVPGLRQKLEAIDLQYRFDLP